jgi:hypothetical protein
MSRTSLHSSITAHHGQDTQQRVAAETIGALRAELAALQKRFDGELADTRGALVCLMGLRADACVELLLAGSALSDASLTLHQETARAGLSKATTALDLSEKRLQMLVQDAERAQVCLPVDGQTAIAIIPCAFG